MDKAVRIDRRQRFGKTAKALKISLHGDGIGKLSQVRVVFNNEHLHCWSFARRSSNVSLGKIQQFVAIGRPDHGHGINYRIHLEI